MIESAEIQNFRGFKLTELTGLSRVNIIVGDNGVGKTALLEALFLASVSSPDVPTRFHVWRGTNVQVAASGTPQEIYDGLFLDIFHNMSKDGVISINLRGAEKSSRSVRIYYDTGEPNLLPFGEGVTSSGSMGQLAHTPITFEWKGASGEDFKATPRIQPNGIVMPPPGPLSADPTFLAARVPLPTTQNATWYSSFSKRGLQDNIISALREQFPYIENMTVEVDMGMPALFVKMPWLQSKIPAYMASDGLNKLITLLLHLAHSERTAIFVDEIENGFHYGRHPKLWSQLLSFAEEYNTQIFATTHSWEFLQAGAKVIEKHPDKFSMIQVYQEKGISDAMVIPGINAGAAISGGLEIRLGHK